MSDDTVDQIGRTLRVVHVISDAGPHPYFRTLIEAGGMDRSAVIVGCIGGPGALQDDMEQLGVRTFALGARSRLAYPLAVVRLARWLRRLRPDVVQTHLVDACLVGLVAARLARVPVSVMTAHHSHELPFHGRRLVWADRVSTRLAGHVVAPSAQVAETLVRYTGISPEKIEVVHHGFDLERLSPEGVDGAAVRRELGLEGKLIFGAIGRIYWLKNYPALVEAFATLTVEQPDATLVIAGGGERSSLQRQIRHLGITDRVLIIGPRTDIPGLLAAFDVFVHPALTESFGMVIIEAMAMARPIVTTRVGIAAEVVDPPSSGILAASPDVADLAAALRQMLSYRASWGAIGRAGQQRVSGFSAARMANRYVQLYEIWSGVR